MIINKKIFYYSSALCGEGKTSTAIPHYVNKLMADPSLTLLYVTPSIELSSQVLASFEAATLDRQKFDIRRIDTQSSTSSDDTVSYQIINFLSSNTGQHSKIAIITNQCFLGHLLSSSKFNDNPDINLSKIILVIDEHPQNLFIYKDLTKLKDHSIFDIFLSYLDIDSSGVITVPAGNTAFIMRVVRGDDYLIADYKNPEIKEIAQIALNPLYKLKLINCDGVIPNKLRAKDGVSFRWIAIMQPDPFLQFHETTIISALFQKSLIYQIWRKGNNVIFERHKAFNKLNSRTHKNGRRLSIHYLLVNKSWTAYNIRDIQEGALREAARLLLAKDPTQSVLFRVNDQIQKKIESEHQANLVGLDFISHGQNQHRAIHSVIYLQSHMPEKYAHDYLRLELGLTKSEIREAWYLHLMYQTLMRCSLRDPSSEEPVNVVVGGKADAEWLQSIFTHSTIQYMATDACKAIDVAEPKKRGRKALCDDEKLSGKDKAWMHREVKKIENVIDGKVLSIHKRKLLVGIRNCERIDTQSGKKPIDYREQYLTRLCAIYLKGSLHGTLKSNGKCCLTENNS